MITALIGNHVVFDYPAHYTTLQDYKAHAQQVVLVLREADKPQQGCEQMYYIRAADGWEGEAWITELSTPGAVTEELMGWAYEHL